MTLGEISNEDILPPESKRGETISPVIELLDELKYNNHLGRSVILGISLRLWNEGLMTMEEIVMCIREKGIDDFMSKFKQPQAPSRRSVTPSPLSMRKITGTYAAEAGAQPTGELLDNLRNMKGNIQTFLDQAKRDNGNPERDPHNEGNR
jgi:hypothetical protein